MSRLSAAIKGDTSHLMQSILGEEKAHPSESKPTGHLQHYIPLWPKGRKLHLQGRQPAKYSPLGGGQWWCHKGDIPIPPTTHTRTLLSIVASLSFCFSTPTYPSIHSCILCPPSGFIPSNSKRLFATEQNRSERSSLKLGRCEEQQYIVEQTGLFCTLWRKYVSVSLTIQ